MAVPPR